MLQTSKEIVLDVLQILQVLCHISLNTLRVEGEDLKSPLLQKPSLNKVKETTREYLRVFIYHFFQRL